MSVDTQRQVSVSRVIPAEAGAIFDLIADPSRHPEIDGSGTVKRSIRSSEPRLALGATFGMAMRIGFPYRITNTVVEFEEGRRLAWRHFGGHRWRYELVPVDGGTEVTETFDWSGARSPRFIEMMRYPAKHVPNMERTLERLEKAVAGG